MGGPWLAHVCASPFHLSPPKALHWDAWHEQKGRRLKIQLDYGEHKSLPVGPMDRGIKTDILNPFANSIPSGIPPTLFEVLPRCAGFNYSGIRKSGGSVNSETRNCMKFLRASDIREESGAQQLA